MPQPRIAPSPFRPVLRVGVLPHAPWADLQGDALDGIEVGEARRYALWVGRELHWSVLEEAELPTAMQTGEVDLAIGGVRATPELRAMARLARYSDQRLDADGRPRGTGYRHVWAVGRGAWREWSSVNAYLQVVRHRKTSPWLLDAPVPEVLEQHYA